MVMHYKGAGTGVDPASIQQLDLPQMEGLPPLDFGTGGIPGLERDRLALPGLEPPPAAAGPGAAGTAARVWSRRRQPLPGLEPPAQPEAAPPAN